MISVRRGVAALALTCSLALVPAGFSLASGGTDKPDAETQPATQITSTTARLNGRVKPRGLATTWWFEYGTTKSYGQSTLLQVGLLGSDWASAVANVSGLQPNTTYHYRLVASNLLGTKQAGDKSFKTAKPDGTGASSDPGGSDSSGSGSSGSGSDSSGSGSSGSGSDDSSGSGSGSSGSGSSGSGSGSSGSGSGSGGGSGDSTPEIGKTVAVEPEEGTVRVREPGKSRWDAVDPTGTLPTGTVVDATKGKITLTTALPSGKTQTATFWGGMFEVRQTKTGGGYTDIHLRGPSLAQCPDDGTKSLLASAAKKKKKRGSRLWGSDKHGRYRTHGRNSVATVRGTTWLTTDRCGGTVTWVRDGAVSVRDKRRKRTVLVRAGHSYFARDSH